MKRAISVVAAVATMSLGSAAAAEQHVILIMSDGYFPQTTYMSPGDTVEFINVSATNQTIISDNSTWTLGPIAPDGTETMIIDESVEKTFYNADLTNEDGAFTVEGSMSFSLAPLD